MDPERKVTAVTQEGWYHYLSDQGRKASFRYKWVLTLSCGHVVDFFSEPRMNRDYPSTPPSLVRCRTCGEAEVQPSIDEWIDNHEE